MGQVTLVTGGARSGKSAFAEALAARRERVCYVATAEALDEEMAERIARHRARRPVAWQTREAPQALAATLAAIQGTDTVVVDCLTLWASNRLLALGDADAPGWWAGVAALEETLTQEVRAMVRRARAAPWDLVVVTNEVGLGVVPASRLGRAFTDLLGRLNQTVAAEADAVYLLVAGQPVELKANAARTPAIAGASPRTDESETVRQPDRTANATARPGRAAEPDRARAVIEAAIRCIGPLDSAAVEAARTRQDSLTKPQGSLGRLERLHLQLAGITGQPLPPTARKAVIVMAGDHGVAAEGVSAYPAAVTPQMVVNFTRGGAAINVLAGQAGARVVVVDIGVAADLPDDPAILRRRVAAGTANMAHGPAMTRSQARAAIAVGIDVVTAEVERGLDLVATGDMGIGNTTASSAIVAAMTGKPVPAVTGRGTGIDDAGLARKVATIERALAVTRPDRSDPLDVLAKVGGFEIAGLVGVLLGAAAQRVPVVVDGFISGAAALIAAELCPAVGPYLIAAHVSVEAGHTAIFERLGMVPLLNLDLRLGEGTGAALAFHLIEAACRLPRQMATFAEAGVATRDS